MPASSPRPAASRTVRAEDAVAERAATSHTSGKQRPPAPGLKVPRKFTRAGGDPFETVQWEKRASRIRDEEGKTVFEMPDAEVPADWSQIATDIIASKYFRRAGVPEADGAGRTTTGAERSARQVIARLTNCWRWWGERHGYFARPEDANAFEEELQYMLLHQMAAPNSPQWFNTGLALSYGITGPAQGHAYVDPETGTLQRSKDAYTRPQTSACFIQSVKDSLLEPGGIMDLVTRETRVFKYGSGTGTNFSSLREAGAPLSGGGMSSGLMSWLKIFDRAAGAVKSGGTTRRAAKMVILDVDHPDIEEFIWWKANEEKKVAALIAAGYPSDFNAEAYQTVSGQNANNSVRVSNAFLEAVEKDRAWGLKSRAAGRGIVKTVKARKLWRDIADAAWQSADPGIQYDTTIQEWHTCSASGRINATNPCCVTGDTRIAVADGRDPVPIRDLVGQEVPVYAWDHARGRTTIGRMWNIGVKRQRVPVFRVTLDDGSSFRATDDHLIMLRDGSYRQAGDLQAGDSLMPFHAKVRRHAGARTPRRFIHTGRGWRAQERWLWERTHGKQPSGMHIHHQNLNSLDDRPENLRRISEAGHVALHRDRVLGENNPARRFMNPQWRARIARAVRGEGNPNFGKVHGEETRMLMRRASARRWGDPAERERASRAAVAWMAQAGSSGRTIGRPAGPQVTRTCPACRTAFATPREGQIFCSRACRQHPLALAMIGKKHGEAIRGRPLSAAHREAFSAAGKRVADPRAKRRARVASLRAQALRAAHAASQAGVEVQLETWDEMREAVRALEIPHVPSAATLRQFFTSDAELRDAAEHYNHHVVAVVPDGVEDVYDGTVDGHHNFSIVTSATPSPCARGAEDFSGVFVHNSEYVFLDDTACNLASLNLMKFVDEETGRFDVDGYVHAVRLWTMVLEISVLMSQFPAEEIAQRSYEFRTLGLGYANLGTLLMVWGIPYDSPKARAIAGALTAILTGEAYATSARMAAAFGPFPAFPQNREVMLRVIRNHRRAAYAAPEEKYEGLSVKPLPIDHDVCPEDLLSAAHRAWDDALELGEKHGYRNAQVSAIAPTGTISLLMDCDTTGVEPDFALVKFKKLAGGGYFKIVNQSVPKALRSLGYADEQIHDIVRHVTGTFSFTRAPHVNREALETKGFTAEDVARVEKHLPGVFTLSMAFTPAVLGEHLLQRLGLAEKARRSPALDALSALGFSREQIAEANEEICGRMTIEGAPHLMPEHAPVFDCANACGEKGTRSIATEGHIRMLAAVQPFVSGSISKTVNMPKDATADDAEAAYMTGWKLGLKCNALYRDGSKLSQPLSAGAPSTEKGEAESAESRTGTARNAAPPLPRRVKLPRERRAVTRKVDIAGQEFYVNVGMYPDGTPGEVFITMSQEGTFTSGMADAFAKMVSIALQYGVPLDTLTRQLRHMRFSPDGFTGDPDIPTASSVVDFLAQWLEKTFPGGRWAQEKLPFPDEKARADGNGGPAAFRPAPGMVMTVARQQGGNRDVERGVSAFGFTGDTCGNCSSIRMVQNGNCKKCLDCGETTGCS